MGDNIYKKAIIGGSQGFRFLKNLVSDNIRQIQTPFGISPTIHIININDTKIIYVSRHGENGYEISAPFVNYRAIIWALKELGVERIVAWSGPGAINLEIPIGDILLPLDIIDETKGREYTFYKNRGWGFIRQNPVFCEELQSALKNEITSYQGHCRNSDIYVCTQGPRLETPAEIRKFDAYGGDLVGMTLVPEAFLARELEICYSPICYVTNYAEGLREMPYKEGVLFEGLLSEDEKEKVEEAVSMLPQIAINALLKLSEDRKCVCRKSMERYKKRGIISEDWHEWIGDI
ncbi:MAG: MTAP family purine nucleoside phosphorylase [Armatimonadota bacterium]